MRFLWQSNAPWAGTGYGQQTKIILKQLKELGHEPTCVCFYGLQGGEIEYDGYKCIPGSDYDAWGNDVIKLHAQRHKAEAIVTLMDLFVLNENIWSSLPVPWVAWVPIDHEEIGFPTIERLKFVDFPVAMSKFGAQEMLKAGIEPAATIPHCVDTEVFKPLDKWECRKYLDIDPDCYLVGMVMANKGDRKQYPAQLYAIRRWMEENPTRKIKVFLHCDPTSSMGGWDMKALVHKLGLKGQVYSTNQYDAAVVPVPPETMAKIYNSFDVLMNASSGEGFGIPIIEAQACGVPVITQGVTSMTELTHYGYAVKSSNRGLASHFGWQFHPDVDDMVYRLESVYRMADGKKAVDARQWIINNFSIPTIVSYWHNLLEAVAEAPRVSDVRPEANGHRPRGLRTSKIEKARAAMESEAHEYGEYHHRIPEYALVYGEMLRLGLQPGDFVLDVGAGLADLDRFMRDQGWSGVYAPVDMIIDGTDISRWKPPAGFDFVVIQQAIEHISNWKTLLKEVEEVAGAVIITTPNGEVVPEKHKHDYEGQMAHKVWLKPDDLRGLGYTVSLHTMTGEKHDTILASKAVNYALIE